MQKNNKIIRALVIYKITLNKNLTINDDFQKNKLNVKKK